MNTRWTGLANIARQQPYEGGLAIALAIAAGWSISQPPRSEGVLGRILTQWQVDTADAMLICGGLLTVGGLLAVGVVANDVRRVLARRVEQTGQVLMCGVLTAEAVAALSLGTSGVIGGLVYGSLAAAAGMRSTQVSRAIRGRGIERTELGE